MYRIGLGTDLHRLTENRKLILGGVEIPFEKGLLGHSDADVLAHAIIDAFLGALALGDIGKLFPDTDEKYKNADSMELLKTVYKIIKEKNYKINNLDCVINAQKPKLLPYIDHIKENIAKVLECEVSEISVKSKTGETIGIIGEGLAISTEAIVLLKKAE